MTNFERLLAETRDQRQGFLDIPLVAQAMMKGASRETYLMFLGEAYHHVKQTFPLLSLAAATTRDEVYRRVLAEYMHEEYGHESWILDDIRALGGDADRVAGGQPRLPCRVMVAQAYYAIQWESPYSLLGMVHVLEGLSEQNASRLARLMQDCLHMSSDAGFSYLRTHGELDVDHAAMFAKLVDSFTDAAIVDTVIANARIMYQLYGAIFRDLGAVSGVH